MFILSYIALGTIFYIHVEVKQTSPEKAISQDTIYTWTSSYNINGAKLRGFVVTEDNDKWYVTYTFQTEQEKISFQEHSLTGSKFMLDAIEDAIPKPAHDYSFKMETFLTSHGASGMLAVSALKIVSEPSGLLGWIADRRFSMKKQIESHFPLSLQGEAKALLLGLRDDVSQEETRAYQILGITHLFAISGLHVAFLTYLFYQSMLRLRIRKEVAVWGLLICLPVYAILVGGAPSVWRAVLVVELILLSRKIKGRLSMEDAFALSIIFYIFLLPGVLYQVGFQLSYGATAALIFSSSFLKGKTSVVSQSFWITFLCQIGVAPILLIHFYEISLSSFIVNLLFVPLFSAIILPLNLFLFLLTFILPTITEILIQIYEPLRSVITLLIMKISSLPHQLWNPGKLATWQFIIAYLGIGCTFLLLELQKPLKMIFLALGLPVAIIIATPYFDSSLEVTFLNVGQGDATVIELPNKQGTVLIDAGGLLRFEQSPWKQPDTPFEIGREVVVPFLKGRGISYIDTFILTHADSDHIEGAEEILEEVQVGEVHITPGAILEPTMHETFQTALSKKVAIKERIAGNSWHSGDVHFSYVSPQDITYEGNNDSLVLVLEHDSFKALFTGDLEKDGEEDLLERYEGIQNITLLKAGHHGSNTSSSFAFIKRLAPVLTVFSAGKNNRYGHPHADVVERFKVNHLTTLTTGEVDSVHVRYHDDELEIRTTSKKGTKKIDLSQ